MFGLAVAWGLFSHLYPELYLEHSDTYWWSNDYTIMIDMITLLYYFSMANYEMLEPLISPLLLH